MSDHNDYDGINDASTPRVPRKQISPLEGAGVPFAAPASPEAHTTTDGAFAPGAPSPEAWQARVFRGLLDDNFCCINARHNMLTAAEVLACEWAIEQAER